MVVVYVCLLYCVYARTVFLTQDPFRDLNCLKVSYCGYEHQSHQV